MSHMDPATAAVKRGEIPRIRWKRRLLSPTRLRLTLSILQSHVTVSSPRLALGPSKPIVAGRLLETWHLTPEKLRNGFGDHLEDLRPDEHPV